MKYFSAEDIYASLSMADCIASMRQVLAEHGRGECLNPLRRAMLFPDDRGLLAMMPAYLGAQGIAGFKGITVMPGNHGSAYDAHQGIIYLAETGHGSPLAVFDASSITALRTAAASGVATDLLARKNTKKLALLGSGLQALTHLQAMMTVRDFTEVVVWSRNADNAAKFVIEQKSNYTAAVSVATSVEEAVADADVICTITASQQVVLQHAWVAPGCHINAVGACQPHARELDSQLVAQAALFVDSIESVLNEAGDFIIPRDEGCFDDSHIKGEIGALLLEKIAGRTSETDITLFKSLGIAVEDLALAHFLYQKRQA